MVKRTHGEKRHTIRGMGLARRKQKPCKRSVLRKSCTFIEIFFRNRLTKSRRDGKIYRQSAVAVKIESGRVPEWPMGTDCKSAAFQLRWFESTRAHQEIQYPNRVLDFLFCRLFSGLGGRIRTAAALSQKTAQKQPGSRYPPAPTKRSSIRTGCWIFCFVETFSGLSGWIRTASARRTVRRAKKPQWGFFRCAARDIHPCPPRDPVSEPGTGFSVLWKLFQGRAGRRQM